MENDRVGDKSFDAKAYLGKSLCGTSAARTKNAWLRRSLSSLGNLQSFSRRTPIVLADLLGMRLLFCSDCQNAFPNQWKAAAVQLDPGLQSIMSLIMQKLTQSSDVELRDAFAKKARATVTCYRSPSGLSCVLQYGLYIAVHY
ncbi:hypothetical protein pipiens_018696 [Culex pipiens pipiens]|uniref:Uncharacterized protein n=1 Tax=Culex pipiens pipiens TaxID=38569 RepID=A0ABD1CAF6_CULPP